MNREIFIKEIQKLKIEVDEDKWIEQEYCI